MTALLAVPRCLLEENNLRLTKPAVPTRLLFWTVSRGCFFLFPYLQLFFYYYSSLCFLFVFFDVD